MPSVFTETFINWVYGEEWWKSQDATARRVLDAVPDNAAKINGEWVRLDELECPGGDDVHDACCLPPVPAYVVSH